jgi:phage anti-repressor protein
LQIGRDFSNWIKSFINSYKFVENQDFEVIEGLSSPNLASSKERPQRTKEYLLTMDRAKWIALSANNARGDEARHDFPQRNSAADPSPDGYCDLHEPEANWGPGNYAEDDAFLAQVAALTNAYVGKPNDQETREQLSLELTASVTQEPAEASVEPADPTELLPIDSSNPVRPLVNARDLHAFLKVGKVFGAWITERIERFKFVAGQDFTLVEGLSFPNLESSKARPQKTKDYLLTMDMAKWIALSANNARGHEARHYFIAWENKMWEAYTKLQQQVLDMSDPLVTARLYIEAEEARRAALLEHGRTRLDLQLSEIKNGVLTQRVAEKTKQIDLLADKLSTNEDSCLIEDFARSTGDCATTIIMPH